MSGKKPTYDITDAPASKTEKFAAPGTSEQKAVALRYAHGRDNAPVLSAKGESEIPLEAFAAVAEILNYIYRINRIYGDPSRSQTEPTDRVAAAPSGDRNGEGQS